MRKKKPRFSEASMNIPYNNGKIKMGSNYTPPKYVECDGDMLLLQTALVGDVKSIRRSRLYNLLYVGLVVFVIFSLFLFGDN